MPETGQMIVWLITGALAGAAANKLLRREYSFAAVVIIGLLGAVVGGFLFDLAGIDPPDKTFTFTLADLITSFVGALVLIMIVQLLFRRK
ncbi:MAG: GlsB/YeaQ/YmgE family stress response membrane protein [Anaerolineae bacterium]|jgi:uncharacterized membrane protein YeaQ/YmgE (transglycosylase-associated protein family)|nr:GlsB/YeaQ/YmgE family stress response membrane protein [Anaerolineae bacterium]